LLQQVLERQKEQAYSLQHMQEDIDDVERALARWAIDCWEAA
jgi:hypothetical protein